MDWENFVYRKNVCYPGAYLAVLQMAGCSMLLQFATMDAPSCGAGMREYRHHPQAHGFLPSPILCDLRCASPQSMLGLLPSLFLKVVSVHLVMFSALNLSCPVPRHVQCLLVMSSALSSPLCAVP